MSENSIFALMQIAAMIIPTPFSGKYSELGPFIDSINLLDRIHQGQQTELLILFLKSRLRDDVYDAVCLSNFQTVQEIITFLKDRIKPNRPSYILDKMKSLELNMDDIDIFLEAMKKLSFELKQSLVYHGSSCSSAERRVINDTINVCCCKTFSTNIKNVLNSVRFNCSNDVISKFEILLQQRNVTSYIIGD